MRPRNRRRGFAFYLSIALIAFMAVGINRANEARKLREAREESALQAVAEARAQLDQAEADARIAATMQARREFVGPPVIAEEPAAVAVPALDTIN